MSYSTPPALPLAAHTGYELSLLGTVTVPDSAGAFGFIDVDPPLAVTEGTFIGFVNTAGAVVSCRFGVYPCICCLLNRI